jgi:DNA polymerase III delta subunit
MARATAAEFEKGLKKGLLPKDRLAVYFLYGSGAARIQAAAEALKASFLPGMGGPESFFRVIKLGGKPEETDVRGVVAQLNTVSMFGSGKLVWVGPLESLPKDLAEPLAAYAANPNPQSTLILTILAEKRENIKSLEDSPFAAAAALAGAVVRFDKMSEANLAKWAAARLAELGVEASSAASAMMAELCGNQTGRLAMEIEKVAAYAGYSGKLAAGDVEEIMADQRMEEVWSLTAAFCGGDLRRSQEALTELLANGAEPQVILKTLALEVSKSAAAWDLKRRRGSAEEFYTLMGENPFSLRQAWEREERWDAARAHKALAAILKAQMDMMTAQVSPETALETMLLTAMAPTEKR